MVTVFEAPISMEPLLWLLAEGILFRTKISKQTMPKLWGQETQILQVGH